MSGKEIQTNIEALQQGQQLDGDTLSALALAQNETVLSQNKTILAQADEIQKLKAEMAWLKRKVFGSMSEKMKPMPEGQLTLFDDDFADAEVKARAIETEKKVKELQVKERRQARQNRKMLEGLPVLKREVIEPGDLDLSLYKKVGEEVTRVVCCDPGKIYIKEIVRPKYALKDSTVPGTAARPTFLLAPMPLLPIYKGLPDASLLADVLLKKYEYHMPFYRQAKEFAHLGFNVGANTIDGWFKPAVNLLRPLYESLLKELGKSHYHQADETTVPVLDKEKHAAPKEYLWMVRAPEEKIVTFFYRQGSRAGEHILKFEKNIGFSGTLQCDGFPGYESVFGASAEVCLLFCMAHIRRYFERAQDTAPEAAKHVLEQIQLLYRIERYCTEQQMTPEQRSERRKSQALPIMQGLKVWFETEGVKFSQASPMGTAVTYAYKRWNAMMHYATDGRLHIDNNLAENAIRPITLGRKNYLFCGDHEAADCMSVVCSLLATCKANEVNPRDYLNDIIARMPYMQKATHEELLPLLPQNWVKA